MPDATGYTTTASTRMRLGASNKYAQERRSEKCSQPVHAKETIEISRRLSNQTKRKFLIEKTQFSHSPISSSPSSSIASILRHMDTRVAFNLFGLDVYWYGIILTTGMMVAVYFAALELGRRGFARSILRDGPFWCWASQYWVVLVPRLLRIQRWHARLVVYREHPLEILDVRSGGLGVFGGIALGAVGCIILAFRHKVPYGVMADSVGVGLIMGQCIGRWGNYANQELYGPPTNLPWGMQIQEWARTGIYRDLQTYPIEPTFFTPRFSTNRSGVSWAFCCCCGPNANLQRG